MTKQRKTSPTIASKASDLLRDGRTSKKQSLLPEVLYHNVHQKRKNKI